MPRIKDPASRKVIGRNLAAYLLVSEHMKTLPTEERRRRAMRALQALAQDPIAKRSEIISDEARTALIEMMKKQ